MTDVDRMFSFHVEGTLATKHSLPASVLVQILQNAQRAFELIGIQVEGKTVKSRARLPKSSVGKFQLICQIPVHGCYALPVYVGGEAADLLFPEQAERATSIFKNLLSALMSRNSSDISAALPDGAIRNRVLESIKGMLPQIGANWYLDFYDGHDTRFSSLNGDHAPFIDELVVPPEIREASQTVTGTLSRVDFSARKLTIIYPVTNNREMDCFYPEELEDLLFENRRGLLQVTGSMILDDSGVPKSIIDVSDIREVDLSPYTFSAVSHDSISLKAVQAIELQPFLDETKQLICLVDVDLGIDVYAETRHKLSQELDEQIAMLWREYVLVDDDVLDELALNLKKKLQISFVEVKDGT